MLNVVIIGASTAGHIIASQLAPKLPASHRIVIIDPAPTSYWPIASLRAAVVPGFESKVYHKLEQKNFFPANSKNVLVRQRVVSVEPASIVLDGEFEGSSQVPFDALVFATGASQPFPMRPKQEWSAEEIERHFKVMQQEIAASKNIVVMGGGPTGIEFVGEILGKFTGGEAKNITLIHRPQQLIDARAYKKLATTLEQKLRKAGVNLVLGDEHVAGPDFKVGKQDAGAVVRTKQGKEIPADYVFVAVGNSPNTQLLEQVDPSAVSANKLIKVNDHLQVKSTFFTNPNVFAAGDCADAPGWRSFVSSETEAGTVTTNLLAAIKKSSLKIHKAGPRAMVVPLGTTDGAGFAQLPLLGDSMLPEFLIPTVKGKDLFTAKFHGRFLA
ncbi:hypothetical protein FFLO_04893 [Filobasidium floriforme]|uniref:FAD/NAD(P)-binding domain-containing protein n=1 Tax=Filobasidium floriforme TaxID=5210 RepID=A0A8K0JI18_9TREE|nr:hypothetical protein FFLO_04893 [Filobasidium floriforme]